MPLFSALDSAHETLAHTANAETMNESEGTLWKQKVLTKIY
jgi:hypothetical protein